MFFSQSFNLFLKFGNSDIRRFFVFQSFDFFFKFVFFFLCSSVKVLIFFSRSKTLASGDLLAFKVSISFLKSVNFFFILFIRSFDFFLKVFNFTDMRGFFGFQSFDFFLKYGNFF